MFITPLSKDTKLFQNRFIINAPIHINASSIIYSATDLKFSDKCVIREFAFHEFSSRNSKTKEIIALSHKKLADQAMQQFEEEAYLLSKIHHPNLVSIRTQWSELGTVFYAMKHIEGPTLPDPSDVNCEPMSWNEVEHIAHQLLDGMEALHQSGLIHGDIRPKNVIQTKDQRIILINLKSAKLEQIIKMNSTFTQAYSSPEDQKQKQDQNGPRSDLYSWAIVIFGLMTNHIKKELFPLNAKTRSILREQNIDPYENIHKHLANVPNHIVQVLHKCLLLEPNKRYQSVDEVRKALLQQEKTPIKQQSKLIFRYEKQTSFNAKKKTIQSLVSMLFFFICIAVILLFYENSHAKREQNIQLTDFNSTETLSTRNSSNIEEFSQEDYENNEQIAIVETAEDQNKTIILRNLCTNTQATACTELGEFFFQKQEHEIAIQYFQQGCDFGDQQGCDFVHEYSGNEEFESTRTLIEH